MSIQSQEFEEGECSGNSERTVKQVVRMLNAGNPLSVIIDGVSIMMTSIYYGLLSREHLERIASQPGVLEGIVSLLSLDNCQRCHEVGLTAFYNLAKSDTNKMRLVSPPGAVEGLVNLFSRTTDSRTQLMSLEVFGLLSQSPEINLELGRTPGVMPSLQYLQHARMSQNIRTYSRHVIKLLNSIEHLSNMGRIHPRTLESLLSRFSDEKPAAFRRAGMLIFEYVKKFEKDEAALASHTEVIARLLSKKNNDVVESNAITSRATGDS